MLRSVIQEIEQIQELSGLGKRAGGSWQDVDTPRSPLYSGLPASSPGALWGQGQTLPRAGPRLCFPFLLHQRESHCAP